MHASRAIFTSLTVVCCFTAARTAAGQSPVPLGPHRFGFVGGVNSATFGGSDATMPTPDNRTGFIGGMMIVLPFQPNLAFQSELLFTMKGALIKDPSGNATFKMNYVQLPVLLRFDVPTAGMIRPYGVIGPAIAFRQSCNIVISGQFGGSGTCDDLVGSNPKLSTVDYSAIFGGGLAFDVSGQTLTIGARYEPSLNRIQKDTDIKHRVISVLTTFELPLGRK